MLESHGSGFEGFFFFFKQKTAYEITRGLEFRRVLFRSPVTAVSVPSGMRVSTPWRLCRRAPFTSSQRHAGRRADGTPMRFSPDRYCPVRVPAARTSAAGPWYTSAPPASPLAGPRSEEHTSELQSPCNLVCRLLLEKKKKHITAT